MSTEQAQPTNSSSPPEPRDRLTSTRRSEPPAFTPELREPRFTIEKDVVLAEDTRTQIEECLARLRYHKTIYSDWNFGSVDPMGLTTIINFYGPSGTGKTLAAEALAGTLGFKFYHLGIAELESKFMGETARNISAAFDAARHEGALLFFDEADTLLGKRLSSVTQGVDNEVNAMRSTMLIELERFDGLVVFATNFERNYDEAFRSRIGYHVHFALPDAPARHQLWSRVIVDQIPLADTKESLVERCVIASEGMSGREIRTCMRLALPKPLLACAGNGAEARLAWPHVEQAIADVRRASEAIGQRRSALSSSQDAARSMLGV